MAIKTTMLGTNAALISSYLRQDTTLPAATLEALKIELAKPAYAGKSVRAQLQLLNAKTTVPNPVVQGVNKRTSCTPDEFSKFLVGPRAKAATSQDPAISGKYAALSAALLPLVANMTSIDLTSSTLQQIIGQMEQDGLVSAADVAAFLDPSWTPTVQQSPADTLAPGYFLTVADVADAVAFVAPVTGG